MVVIVFFDATGFLDKWKRLILSSILMTDTLANNVRVIMYGKDIDLMRKHSRITFQTPPPRPFQSPPGQYKPQTLFEGNPMEGGALTRSSEL